MAKIVPYVPHDSIHFTPPIERQASRLLRRIFLIDTSDPAIWFDKRTIRTLRHLEALTEALTAIECTYEKLVEWVPELEPFMIEFSLQELPVVTIILMRRGACFRLYRYDFSNPEGQKIAA